MTDRYFLAPTGDKVALSAMEDHADVGRRVLADIGICPKDYADIYDQMFQLGYTRVVEFPDRICAENLSVPLTHSQLEFLHARRLHGGSTRELQINNSPFAETRRWNHLTI